MELSTYPLTSASSKWGELASEMSALGLGEIPTVEGVFAEQINTWIAGAVQNLAGFSTAATELSSAAGESSDEESKLAAAPTLADIAILGKEIKDDSDAGRDFTEKAKRLKEMKAEHDAAKEELETSSTETSSQTGCVGIPEFEGLGIPGEPQYVPPGSGGIDDPGNKPGGTPEPGEKPGGTPNDPGTDRKLPDVTAKPSPGSSETPSAPTLSDEPSTRLSSDSPAPSTTPTTPSAAPTTAQPTSSAAQQPSMPQVSMGQSPSGGQPQGQQAAAQTPRGNTIDDLKKKMQEAERKSDKDEDKKADDAAVAGDTPGSDVGGAALVTGATAAGVPGAPTAPTVPGAPTAPGTPPPPGGVGGVGGAPAMGSGNAAQSKNANIVAAAQPEPPMPTAPKVAGSQQSPNFDWNSDAVLPPNDNKKDTP